MAEMVNYARAEQVAQQLVTLALQDPDTQRQIHALHAAYRRFARSDDGQVILNNLALVLLKPCKTPEEEGERRLVLSIFTTIRDACRDLTEETVHAG